MRHWPNSNELLQQDPGHVDDLREVTDEAHLTIVRGAEPSCSRVMHAFDAQSFSSFFF
jgi:hypothetical protein